MNLITDVNQPPPTYQAIASSGTPTRLLGAWRRKHAIGILAPAYGSEKVSCGVRPAGHRFVNHRLDCGTPLFRHKRRRVASADFCRTTSAMVLKYAGITVSRFRQNPVNGWMCCYAGFPFSSRS